MTKKDYIIIASVFKATAKIWTDTRAKWIKRSNADDKDTAIDAAAKVEDINKILASMNVIARVLSLELAKDNPKFDAQKFAALCDLPQELGIREN